MSNAPRVLLRSEESAGEVSAIEVVASPERPGPPLHHHPFASSVTSRASQPTARA
jgi:hypothetical protein